MLVARLVGEGLAVKSSMMVMRNTGCLVGHIVLSIEHKSILAHCSI